MTYFVSKPIAILVAGCTGLGTHADACEKHGVPPAERRGTEISRFALVGMIDVDRDGKSDLEVIRRMIKQNGGAIDAELGIDGKLTGSLRRDTGYILLGELPDKTTVSPTVAKQFDAFLRRAAKWNTLIVPIDELLQSGKRRDVTEGDHGLRFRPRRPPPACRGGY